MTYYICKRFPDKISAGHYIKDYKGKCSRPHGHNITLEVCVKVESLNEINIGIDFLDIKKIVDKKIVEPLDHRVLNEVLGVDNMTSEVLAKYVYDTLKPSIPDLYSVRVYETSDSWVEYHDKSE